MTLQEKIKIIRDFYGYSSSYYNNMNDAIEKSKTDNNYVVTSVTVSKIRPFLLWQIEHLIGEYYFNSQKSFDFSLIETIE